MKYIVAELPNKVTDEQLEELALALRILATIKTGVEHPVVRYGSLFTVAQ